MKIKYFVKSFIMIFFIVGVIYAQSSNTLWYKQAAEYFEEGLVLGNGKTGATVFGGVNSDKILLNDATLWSGEPVNANVNPDAYKNLPEIRQALKDENYKLADELNHKLQGKFSESFAPLGTLFLNFHHNGAAQNYYRELNINDAVSKVSYEVNGIKFIREYFISHPDQIMVIKLTAGKKGALNFDVSFKSQLKYSVSNDGNILKAEGYAPYHAEPEYRGDMPNAVQFDKNRGIHFTTLTEIRCNDGAIQKTDSTISLKNGSEALIFVSIATSFNGFDKDPVKNGMDNNKIALGQLTKAVKKAYSGLKESHVKDYQKYFNRVSLNLGKTNAPDLPTNERLKRYSEGKEDKNLEILYFQYGRYLLISSSRTDGIPANLQGIWNPYIRPPWSSNYTLNINVEENYWPVENTNLSEMHAPLLSFLKHISQTGVYTAKNFYGTSGWAAGHNSDIWALSNPVGDFGKGDPNWANWNMGGVWLSTHIWEHYLFTQDKLYLKKGAYDILKGAAQFCIDWLIEDKNGELITSPSTSPENIFITPNGYHGATMYGGTADLAIIRECLENTIAASKTLNKDSDFRLQLESTLSRLSPFKISKKGSLQEWYYDWEDQDPQHRHQSHLFGLYPGHQITPDKTPELANACKKTLEIRGDESTGWSKAWRINLWARLWEGNHAYKMYRELLTYIPPDGSGIKHKSEGGTYPNLFDAHPPFQIDGNFAGTAAVVEMLLQSDENQIRLLPALPDAWSNGSVKGLCARGGYVVSMEWKNKELIKLNIKSVNGGSTKLICGNKQKNITLEKGQTLNITW